MRTGNLLPATLFRDSMRALHSQDGLERIGGRLLVMLVAYIDDSADAKKSAALASGFLATESNWEAYTTAAQALLEKANVPPNQYGIREFHMVDFEVAHRQSGSPFHKWTRDDKAAFMAAWTGAIRDHVMMGMTVCTPTADYRIARPFLTVDFPKTALGFSVLECIKCVREWLDKIGSDEPVTYIIDRFDERADITDFMDDLQDDEEGRKNFRLFRWAWGQKATDVPIQAADVLAYESQKEWMNFYINGGRFDPRRSLLALAPKITCHKLGDLRTLFYVARYLEGDIGEPLDDWAPRPPLNYYGDVEDKHGDGH